MKKIALLLILLFSWSFYSQTIKTYLPPYPAISVENTSNTPYPANIAINPPLVPEVGACGAIGNYNVGANNEYSVQVGPSASGPWTDLFEYNAFVNKTSGSFFGSSSVSFVSFEYDQTIYVKVRCNQFAWVTDNIPESLTLNKIKIKPLSRNIQPIEISENYFIFPLTSSNVIADPNNWDIKPSSDKLSIEINGDRYTSLNIFANKIQPPVIQNDYNTDKIYSKENNGTAVNLYNKNFNQISGKKILIKSGAVVIVPYEEIYDGEYYADNGSIILNNGDEIYIEGGGILKGGLVGHNVNNVKIGGNGIIDLTNYKKQYSHEESKENMSYAYRQGISFIDSYNISIKGVTINDPQTLCVGLIDCNDIVIDNVKMFSRVLWGDGIHMTGGNNITINDCFNRTSDDCIAIYASRHVIWEGMTGYKNRDVFNLTVTNTVLYGDNAHAVEIGWHGNQGRTYVDSNNFSIPTPLEIETALNLSPPILGKYIYGLKFGFIDILEHDSNWVQSNGAIHSEYDGAVSINCSDNNECNNILFKNINIEDFTSGSILRVEVTPKGTGDAVTNGNFVRDIRFQNLSYTGTGERKSVIKGINCGHYVDGVHFENFNIKTSPSQTATLVTSANWLNYIDKNDYAYNITFQEANNYGTSSAQTGLGSGGIPTGIYKIRNATNTSNYLGYSGTTTISPAWITSTTNTNSLWAISEVNGHYLIRPYRGTSVVNNLTLTNPLAPDKDSDLFQLNCQARYLTFETIGESITNQEWKIKGPTTYNLSNKPISATYKYNINNAYTRSYLTNKLTPLNVTNPLTQVTNIYVSPKKTDPIGINLQNWNFIYIGPYNLAKSISTNENDSSINDEIKVYPNPTKDYLFINNFKSKNNGKIQLIDLKGSILISKELTNENSKIYVGDITDGVYIVTISNDEGVVYSEKFVKEH